MPLYDCMLLMKPKLDKNAMLDLVSRIGRRVYSMNGVVTEIKSMGKINLAYAIRKHDGKYYQGYLMQLTMMAAPKFNTELYYLNKDNRMLRWLLVKHRGDAFADTDFMDMHDGKKNLYNTFNKTNLVDDDMEDENDEEEYEVEDGADDEHYAR